MQFQQWTERLSTLIRGKAKSTRRSPRRTTPLRFENLEERRVMSCHAVLDFDGAFVSKDLLESVGWSGLVDDAIEDARYPYAPAPTDRDTPAFHELYNRIPGEDYLRAANMAIRQITEIVRQQFSPYDLEITVANSDANGHRLVQDHIPGDVIVIVTGGMSFPNERNPYFENANRYGRAGEEFSDRSSYGSDTDNTMDNIVYVYGGEILEDYRSLDCLPQVVANEISRQMGSAFGLLEFGRLDGDPGTMGDIMSLTRRACPLTFVDAEQEFTTAQRVQAYLDAHPAGFDWGVFNTTQNTHQHLTSVLGPSDQPWAAVLKPGELTIHGDDYGNQITVSSHQAREPVNGIIEVGREWWPEYLTVSLTTGGSDWGVSAMYVVREPTTIGSLNVFDEQISQIRVYGEGGNDDIRFSSTINAQISAYGGEGSDVLVGTRGSDRLYGGGGVDFLYGMQGHDRLYGGSGNDYLFGGTGNDYLYGQLGSDRLYGMEGYDRLWGADSWRRHDGDFDLLNGGSVGAVGGGRRPYYRFLGLSDPYVDTFYTAIGEDHVADDRGNDVMMPDWSWQYLISAPTQPKK